MSIAAIRIAAPAAVMLLVVECLAAQSPVESRQTPPPTGTDIFQQVERANAVREAALQSYTSIRRYMVLEPGHAPDADLLVSMQFVAPSTKTFSRLSEEGVGWIHKRVFGSLMNAEKEAADGLQKADSAITPANYSAQFVGDDQCQGRACYVLALQAKRESKYLLTGRVWIDKEDLAIARIEGEPVRNLSFWVERAHLVREYQRIGRFWLPLRDETRCHIRFVGDYLLRITYSQYKSPPGSSAARYDPFGASSCRWREDDR